MSEQGSSAPRDQASRRDFIKTSSAVAVGGVLAGSMGLARTAHAAGSDQIKIALIGCGGRGSGAAAQALRTEGDVKLVAMADAFKDRLEGSLNNLKKQPGLAERIDVPEDRRFVGFDAYKQAIAAGPDLVILATPPGFRPIHFEAAVEAGKHVFMEKPVATGPAGVRQVLAAAKKAKEKNLGVGVGLQRRHQGNYLETIKRLQDGAIGDIIASRVYWNGSTPWVKERQKDQTEMEYQMRNWYYFNWLCGDHIVEQHIHNLDVINWLKGAYPVACNGMGGREVRKGKEYGETFDHHAVEFEYADGSRMFSQCRHIVGCWNSVSEHVHGSKGTANVAGQIDVKDGEPWRYRGKHKDAYQVEHDDLFASIRAGNPLNEGEIGALSTMTAIFGRMATYSGKALRWDECLNSKVDIMPKEFAWDATPPSVPDQNGFYPIPVPGVTKVV